MLVFSYFKSGWLTEAMFLSIKRAVALVALNIIDRPNVWLSIYSAAGLNIGTLIAN